jgi:hypothetical protein
MANVPRSTTIQAITAVIAASLATRWKTEIASGAVIAILVAVIPEAGTGSSITAIYASSC